MKISYNAFMAALPVILISGCGGSSDQPEPVPTQPSEQKLEIRISPKMSETRATDFGFETGDQVGLYVVNYNGSTPGSLASMGNHVNNMRFTYNGTWTPDSQITWTDSKTHADFYLYYPYANVSNVGAMPFSVKANQSTEEAYKASDLMTGKALDIAPSENAVSIPVDHAMSRIIIRLEAGNGFTAESLAASDVAVKINGVKTDATLNIASGAVTATGSATSVTTLHADGEYKALIVPQTVEETDLITITADGRDYNLKKAFTFEQAKSHRFTVTLSKTSAGINVNINAWIEDDTDNGGTAE